MERLSSPEDLEQLRRTFQSAMDRRRTVIHVCMTGCRAYGAGGVQSALIEAVKDQNLDETVEIRATGCHGFCAKAPIIAIEPAGVQYQGVDPNDAREIVSQTVKENRLIERLAYRDPKSRQAVFHLNQIPFYAKQKKRVLARCGRIDPTRIQDYIAAGGYRAFTKAVRAGQPEAVIAQVQAAQLRGRGGAGFPTGLKWHFAREAPGEPKYIICNADEGDPGAFMDRAILEGDPHAVIEGMLIGAFAIGAAYGYIYVREEYPIAVDHLATAISQAAALGLIGTNILNSGFGFELSLKMGAGAFVCGEETALMASIEGKRGMPSARPPFPAQSGLDGKPSNINNVETLANIPMIVNRGAEWYAEIGTEKSKGTKIFSLAGKVNNTGLVEVPIGTRIREVIFDIGGGIPMGRKFKAVQMGGPSGGCVPPQYLDLPIDYDTLQRIGAIMGSGGMVVMDENNCMVEIARYFLNFTQSESCGKCAACRLGTTQLLTILTRITQGRGDPADLDTIATLGETITEASLCGLGQTCAKPALSTVKYFAKEYHNHIKEQRCPGAVCDAMVISACQHACPAGIDVPNYVAAVAGGKLEQAVAIIRERNPFPAVCGRICIHPCEFKCRRGELDDPVAIRSLKRFAADWYFDHVGTARDPFPVTASQRVAIVGAGPAGLTCAYFLAQAGYPVTVFEAQPEGGGMLGIAVPEFRLPRHIIQAEIDYIVNSGVTVNYNSPIDARHTINNLINDEGFDAVFIAAGAQSSMRLGIAGEDPNLDGFYYGLQFLTDVRLGKAITLSGRVLVIGGGNVAIDAARTAKRIGSGPVDIYYRRQLEEMPAWIKDIEEAIEEGVDIHTSWAPKTIRHKDGRIGGMEFMASKTVYDDDGRARLSVDESAIRTVDADVVIIAVGQAPDSAFLSKDSQIERSLWGGLEVDANTLATNVPGIFAGGDFITGPSTAIEAIASGRRAALAIDKFFAGDKSRVDIVDEKSATPVAAGLALDDASTEDKPRVPVTLESAETRINDFREVERGFASEREARLEAMRCLRCDLEKERRSL